MYYEKTTLLFFIQNLFNSLNQSCNRKVIRTNKLNKTAF